MNLWKIAPAVAIVLLLPCCAPLASADHDALKLVLLVEDRQYSMGSSCRVTVHTYEKGEHTDVDNVPDVKVGGPYPRAIAMERNQTGVYQGVFKIEAQDASLNYVRIYATATKGRAGGDSTVYDADEDTTSIYVFNSTGGAPEVYLYVKAVSDPVLKAGTKVTVVGEVVLLGANTDPTGFNLSASYTGDDGRLVTDGIAAKNLTVGKFEGNYTIPSTTRDVHVTITATARYINDVVTRSIGLSTTNFCVVYHSLGRGGNQSSFELLVSDPYGVPVTGASVELDWWPDNNAAAQKHKSLNATDAVGRTAGTVEYDLGTAVVHLSGHVNSSGRSQSFSGQFEVPGVPGNFRALQSYFEAVYAGPQQYYRPGGKVSREYAIFNNSSAWDNKEVLVYVTAARIDLDRPLSMAAVQVVQADSYSTDAYGRMTVNFTAPEFNSYLFITFKSVTGPHPKTGYGSDHYSTDGNYYSMDEDMVVAANPYYASDVGLEASALKLGVPLKVKATAKDSVDQVATAMWVPGSFDPYTPSGGAGDWQLWAASPVYLNRTSDGSFSGSVTIPPFMPKDAKLTMVVYVGARNTTLFRYNTATLRPTQEVNPPIQIPLLYVIIIIVIIVAAAGGAAYAVHRRRIKARAPQPAPAAMAGAAPAAPTVTAITCPKCSTQFSVTRGPGETRIVCPKCGMAGTLPAQAAPAAPAGAAVPVPEVKVPITCPKCSTKFEVTRGPGETRIICPNCGTQGTLPAVSMPAAPAPAAPVPAAPSPAPGTPPPAPAPLAAPPMRTIACPRCKQKFQIERREGPQHIKCPHCGKEGDIGGRPAAAPAPAQAPPPVPPPQVLPPAVPMAAVPRPAPAAAAQAPAGGRMITCPQCRKPFPVTDPRRPLNVKCPSCGKEGVLRK